METLLQDRTESRRQGDAARGLGLGRPIIETHEVTRELGGAGSFQDDPLQRLPGRAEGQLLARRRRQTRCSLVLDRPTSGRVLVDDVDVTALDDDARAAFRNERLGFVSVPLPTPRVHSARERRAPHEARGRSRLRGRRASDGNAQGARPGTCGSGNPLSSVGSSACRLRAPWPMIL